MRRTATITLLCCLALAATVVPPARPAVAALDCTSFVVQEDAQAVFDRNADDRFGLDPDGNGIACDELPSRDGSPGAADDATGEGERGENGIPLAVTTATVLRVLDGDTLTVQLEQKTETVRLLGIDAPETRDPAQPVECYGAEATIRARKLMAEGATVYLESDGPGRDDAGRLLRYVWIENDEGEGRLVNVLLVRAGFAVATDPPAERYQSRIQKAQDLAAGEQDGLWGACGGPDVPLAAEDVDRGTSAFPDPLAADVDLFWMYQFGIVAHPYVPPAGVVAFESVVDTGCGRASSYDAAFYCPLDQTIYYSLDFRAIVEEEAGDFAWATVIAHEWAHHVQFVLAPEAASHANPMTTSYTIVVELQADCLAGVYARDAETRGWIDPSELDEAEILIGAIGDPSYTHWTEAGAHGSSEERLRSFREGYAEGLIACDVTL